MLYLQHRLKRVIGDPNAELHAEKYDGEEFAPYFGLAW